MSTSTTIIAAIIISFAVSVILCPIVIPMLKKLKFGQYIREEGPKSHQSKSGTPTMGGMIILASVIVTSLIFMFVCKNTRIVPVLFMVIGFGIIGFFDDYIKDVKKIIENAKRMERPVSIATAEEIVANGSDKDLEDYFAIAHHRVNVSEKFEEYVEKDVFQIMLGCDLEERKYILEGTKNAKLAAWWDRAVDIIPKEGGKGTAIEQVLAHYKFSKEEAIAFGDGENDMDMLLSVGKGIAMGNAAEKVKEIAADICESVTDDGIYYYLKSQKLINE